MVLVVTYPAESKTTVFAERTGAGETRQGGRGEAERNFLVATGDLVCVGGGRGGGGEGEMAIDEGYK